MRLIVARMASDYSGRIAGWLDEGVRLVTLRADGGAAVYADVGSRPLQWLDAPNTLTEHGGGAVPGGSWTVTNKKGERLDIRFVDVLEDVTWDLDARKGLTLDGVEDELQRLLADHPDRIEAGLVLVRRELETGIGPVDLWCRDAADRPVAVEIKRKVASLAPVEQLTRYVDRLSQGRTGAVRGILVAQDVAPQARTLCDDRGLGWAEVDLDDLRGLDPAQASLFG